MKAICVILARITESDRNTKLAKVAGKSTLEHIILSVKSIPELHETIIATPQDRFTGYFKKLASDHGCGIYAGDNENITRRIRNAVKDSGCELVIRLNAEMPFFIFNTQIVRKLLKSHVESAADYSYFHGLPTGISPDVVSSDALYAADDEVPYYRRMRSCPDKFRVNKLSTPWNMERLSLFVAMQTDIEIFNKTINLYGAAENTGDTDLFFEKLHSALKSLLENETRLEEIKYFNKKLNFLEMSLMYEHLHSMPLRAQIDVHNGCNLSCTTCSQSRSPLDKKSFDKEIEMKDLLTGIFSIRDDGTYRIEPHPMTPQTYNLIAKELFPYLLTCGFGMTGEPLLNRNILDFLETARKQLVETEIVTNGTLLDERYMQKFVSGLLNRLYVSFDGATKTVFEEIRRGAVFGEVLKNLKTLERIKEANKCKTPSVTFGTNVSSENIGELPAMVKLAADYNVDTVNVTYTHFFKFMDASNALCHHQELVRDKFAEAKEAADRINVRLILPPVNGDGQRSACASLWEDVYFYSRGQVKPCCYIKTKENMASGNFRKIWNSKRQVEFRRSFKTPNDRLKNCLSCQKGEFSGIENKGNFFMTEQNFPH